MPSEKTHCPKCGHAKTSSDKGTLTQWLTGCRCDILPPAPDDNAPKLCTVCGKRIATARKGSITNWVFGTDLCKCDRANTVPAKPSFKTGGRVYDYGRQTPEFTNTAAPDEKELELDAGNFPLDRYKPLCEIGRGASGIVYLCRDRLLGKKVAIKLLHTVTAAQLVDFQNEARATSQLNHPGIVTVMDFGSTASGAPFMVLEYVAGTSLLQFIEDNGQMPIDMCAKVFAELGRALAYTHEKKMFHRDLKSSNIILFDSGSEIPGVRLIDFGVAGVKHANQEPTIVQGVTIAGTPLYMPPDQANGLPYTEQSEVYALGCVLFEALTGRPPFQGTTALETIGMHAHQPAPTLAERRPDLEFKEGIEEIVARCLAKDPANRFPSMSAFSSAINDLRQSPMPAQSTPQAPPQGSTKGSTIPLPAVLIGSLSIIALLVMIGCFTAPMFESLEPGYEGQAWDALKSGNIDSAIDNATSAINRHGANVAALEARAIGYLAKGKPTNALVDIKKAIKLWGNNGTSSNYAYSQTTSLHFHKAVILQALGKEAKGDEAGHEYNPQAWETKLLSAYLPLKRSLESQKKVEQRGLDADQACTLAWKQIKDGNHKLALDTTQRAVAESPAHMGCHDARGVAFFQNGDTQNALFELNAAAGSEREGGMAHFHRGVVFHAVHDNNNAAQDFQSARVLNYEPSDWERTQWGSATKRFDEFAVDSTLIQNVIMTDEQLKKIALTKPKSILLGAGEYTRDGIRCLSGLPIESLTLIAATCTDSDLEPLSALKNLKSLKITNPRFISGSCLKHFALCPLESIHLDDMEVDDQFFVYLNKMRKLKSVNILNCSRFTGRGFSFLTGDPELRISWDPEEHPVTQKPGYPDHPIEKLAKVRNLQSLVLRADALSDADFASLRQLRKVKILTLESNTKISLNNFTEIAAMPELQALILHTPLFEPGAVDSLLGLKASKTISSLVLLGTQISDDQIGKLQPLQLKKLQTAETKLTRNCFPALAKMTSLDLLYFQNLPRLADEAAFRGLKKKLPHCLIQYHKTGSAETSSL